MSQLQIVENTGHTPFSEKPSMVFDIMRIFSIAEAEFYINKTFEFLKRFLEDELKLDLHEIVDRRYYAIFESATVLRNIFEPGIKIDDKVTAIATHSNPIWILPAYSNFEKVLLEQSKKFELHTVDPKNIVEELRRIGKLSKSDSVKFNLVRSLRNKYAHSTDQIDGDDVEDLLRIAIMKMVPGDVIFSCSGWFLDPSTETNLSASLIV